MALKNKDAKEKEAKGRKSRETGGANRARILSILMEKPLTFTELADKSVSGLSVPVLTNHLKALSKEGLVQKAIARDGRVVYEVISRKEAVNVLSGLISAAIVYIMGKKLSAETMHSIKRDLEQIVESKEYKEMEKELEKQKEAEPKVKVHLE